MTSVARHIDEIGDLQIGAMRGLVDDELQIGAGKRGFQALDGADRRILRILYAADDLDRRRIVLRAEGREILEETGFGAVERLENRHRGRGRRRRRSALGEPGGGRRAEQVEAAGRGDEEKDRGYHRPRPPSAPAASP